MEAALGTALSADVHNDLHATLASVADAPTSAELTVEPTVAVTDLAMHVGVAVPQAIDVAVQQHAACEEGTAKDVQLESSVAALTVITDVPDVPAHEEEVTQPIVEDDHGDAAPQSGEMYAC